jgi:hypothetical protein
MFKPVGGKVSPMIKSAKLLPMLDGPRLMWRKLYLPHRSQPLLSLPLLSLQRHRFSPILSNQPQFNLNLNRPSRI